MQAKHFEGQSLRSLIVEPDDYDSDREYPLLVLLHGFGSNMADLAGLVSAISATDYLYACPNAPLTMDFGMGQIGYAWANLDGDSYEREAQASEDGLLELLEEVEARYNVRRGSTILGGFSQGGMMTYRVGLPRPEAFAGLFALSSMVKEHDVIHGRLPRSRDRPIFMSHGTKDVVLPVEAGRWSRDLLREWGYAPEYHEYDGMAHEIRQEVIDDLVMWLERLTKDKLG